MIVFLGDYHKQTP